MFDRNRILHVEIKKSHSEPQADVANLQGIVDILNALMHRDISLAPDWYREKTRPRLLPR